MSEKSGQEVEKYERWEESGEEREICPGDFFFLQEEVGLKIF